MSKVPTHVWVDKTNGDILKFYSELRRAGDITRYKFTPDPETDPPKRPELVWFEHEGKVCRGIRKPVDGAGDYRVICEDLYVLHPHHIAERGIVLRTDFAEDEA